MQVNMLYAKTQLSRLVEYACSGEEVIIARDGKPMVRLVPVEPVAPKKRILGQGTGLLKVDDSFFEPWTEEEIDHIFGLSRGIDP